MSERMLKYGSEIETLPRGCPRPPHTHKTVKQRKKSTLQREHSCLAAPTGCLEGRAEPPVFQSFFEEILRHIQRSSISIKFEISVF